MHVGDHPQSTAEPDREQPGEEEPAPVNPAVIDYGALRYRYLRRGGHIAILERRLGAMEHELAAQRVKASILEEELDVTRQLELRRFDAIQSMLYDLAVPVVGETPGALRSIREAVRHSVPADGRALVATEGRIELLDLYGRETRAFPAPVPKEVTSPQSAIIRQLEALRARGWGYLVLPREAELWDWGNSPFARHVLARYDLVVDDQAALVIDLAGGPRIKLSDQSFTLERLPAIFRSRFRRAPTVLDWHSGAEVAASLPGCAVFAPLVEGDTLDYLDGTADLVVIENSDDARFAEANRVAGSGVVEPIGPLHKMTGAPRFRVRWKSEVSTLVPNVSVIVSLPEARVAQPVAWLRSVLEDLAPSVVSEVQVCSASGIDAKMRTMLCGLDERVAAVGEPLVWPAGLLDRARSLTGEIVVIVEGDGVPLDHWVLPLVRLIDEQPMVAGVCGRVLTSDGSLASAGGMLPDDHDLTGMTFDVSSTDPDDPLYRCVRSVDALLGPVLALRRSVLLDLFPRSADDQKLIGSLVELSRILKEDGQELLYQPDTVSMLFDGHFRSPLSLVASGH